MKNKILTFTLERQSKDQEWGLSLVGGWMEGQWIQVSQLKAGSPAMRAGLRVGDSVVEAGGQLVLFMEQEQVEMLLQEDRLQIALTVERGDVAPLSLSENTVDNGSSVSNIDPRQNAANSQDVVTIVINKDKGIWKRDVQK